MRLHPFPLFFQDLVSSSLFLMTDSIPPGKDDTSLGIIQICGEKSFFQGWLHHLLLRMVSVFLCLLTTAATVLWLLFSSLLMIVYTLSSLLYGVPEFGFLHVQAISQYAEQCCVRLS